MPKAVKNDVVISLGVMEIKGTLMPLRNNEDAREIKTFMVTPCEHHSKVAQRYVGMDCSCRPENDETGYTTGQCLKAREDDEKKIVVLTADDIEATKAGETEKGVLELMLSDSADFERQTCPSGNAYWFEPDKMTTGFTTIATLAGDPSKALYGPLNLKTELFYRVVAGPEGGIRLIEQLRPQNTYFYETMQPELGERDRQMMTMLAEALTEPFDPEKVRSDRADRMRALMAEKTGQEAPADVKELPVKQVLDLTSALQAALAAAQASKV